MQGKTLFLNRAISRSPDWIASYPALSCASNDPQSLSSGRQIVVAAADDDGVRCAFFNRIGSAQDFSATWAELRGARQWWHFVSRWHFWIVDCDTTMNALGRSGHGDLAGYAFGSDAVDRRDDGAFLALLDRIESRARVNLRVCSAQAVSEILAG